MVSGGTTEDLEGEKKRKKSESWFFNEVYSSERDDPPGGSAYRKRSREGTVVKDKLTLWASESFSCLITSMT